MPHRCARDPSIVCTQVVCKEGTSKEEDNWVEVHVPAEVIVCGGDGVAQVVEAGFCVVWVIGCLHNGGLRMEKKMLRCACYV